MDLNISLIEKILKEKKISGAKMSQLLEMSYSSWNTIKKNRRTKDSTFKKIAEVLNIDPFSIMEGYDRTLPAASQKPKQLKKEDVISFTTERVYELININKLSISRFAEILKIPYRTIAHQFSTNSLSITTIAAIAKEFPNLNINWLFRESASFYLDKPEYLSIASEPASEYSSAITKMAESLKRIEDKLSSKNI